MKCVAYVAIVTISGEVLVLRSAPAEQTSRCFALLCGSFDRESGDFGLGIARKLITPFATAGSWQPLGQYPGSIEIHPQHAGAFQASELHLYVATDCKLASPLPPDCTLLSASDAEAALWNGKMADMASATSLAMTQLWLRQSRPSPRNVGSTFSTASATPTEIASLSLPTRPAALLSSPAPSSQRSRAASADPSISSAPNVLSLKSGTPTPPRSRALSPPPRQRRIMQSALESAAAAAGPGGPSPLVFWPLNREQLSQASYEALLLATQIAGMAVSEVGAKAMDLIRVRLSISKRRHHRILETLRLNAATKSLANTIYYRFLLIQQRRPRDFDDVDAFIEWHSRQAGVLVNCMCAMIEKARRDQWTLNKKQMTAREAQMLFSQVFAEMQDLAQTDEDFSTERYDEVVATAAEYIAQLCKQLDAALHTDYSITLDIPVQYPLNVMVYELLIGTAWEETAHGGLHPKHADIFHLLSSIRTKLAITENMHALAFARMIFQQYMLTRRHDVLLSLREDRPFYPGLRRLVVPAEEHSAERRYQRAVLLPVRDELRAQLCDYHRNFVQKSEELPDFVSIYLMLLPAPQAKPDSFYWAAEVTSLIAAGIGAFYERLTACYQRPLKLSELEQLRAKVLEEMDGEKKIFSPCFIKYHPAPLGTALRELALRVVADIECSLHGQKLLSQEVADTFIVVDALGKAMGRYLGSELSMFDLRPVVTPLLRGWLDRFQEMLHEGVSKMFATDKFDPIKGGEGNSTSVLDLFAMIRQTLPFVLNLPVASVDAVIHDAAAVVCNAVVLYCKLVADSVGDVDSMRPPPLPTKKPGMFGKKVDPVVKPGEPLSVLCTKVCNIAFANEQLHSLQSDMYRRMNKGPDQIVTELFKSAFMSIIDLEETVAECVAMRIVFIDVHDVLLDGLYIPTTSSKRMHAVLQKLDPLVSTIVNHVKSGAGRKMVLKHILKKLCVAFEIVLLHGGYMRRFSIASSRDHGIFMEDLKHLEEFFEVADSDAVTGLSVQELRETLKRVHKIAAMFMERDWNDLSRACEACARGKADLDLEMYLCTLEHLDVKAARTFAKKFRKSQQHKK
eukprot:TRINITY_DN4450_c0_g2_i1.p1 TRINITY_DN4450_c0_g2~~TRINITY_DN4450_c0_g2_i1.p1  ORF type:complete len:1078 (-),score=242.68 TRINITY_DN4450_c0_g2_i1:2901-6134(-)